MIVLKDTEKLLREDKVELSADDGRKYGKGTLYLTNSRLMLETEIGDVPRLVALQAIQSIVPVKSHELTVSYINNDGTRIFTDRYKMGNTGNREEWIEDFQEISNAHVSLDIELANSKLSTGRRVSEQVSHDDNQNVNEVVFDLDSNVLSWRKVEGWRKFPEERIWQGTKRLDSMTKEEWLALKKESIVLDETLDGLHSQYYEAKKSKKKQRCREIKEEMKAIDLELYGLGNVAFKSIATDTWSQI